MIVRVGEYRLLWLAAGRLVPWLGPAVRGAAARAFKDAVCRFPPAERDTRWVHCTGCPHLAECAYGRAFEDGDAERPAVLAPAWPAPTRAVPGTAVPLRVLTLGPDADRLHGELAVALADGGRTGLGDDRVPFRLEPAGEPRPDRLDPAALPAVPTEEIVPRLTIRLTAPLVLRRRDARTRQRPVIARPTFADFAHHAIHAVKNLARRHGTGPLFDGPTLAAAAARVGDARFAFRLFSQWHAPSRHERPYEIVGITGEADYAGVPAALVPWLTWAGRLHVGEYRGRGAGSWDVLLD